MAGSKRRVVRRRDGGSGEEHEQAEQHQHHDHRGQPLPLVLVNQRPQLPTNKLSRVLAKLSAQRR
jgi:hypothetical protein